ncbi:hypothetical protein CISIN_1g0005462mg, partial [Citrus sinensis]
YPVELFCRHQTSGYAFFDQCSWYLESGQCLYLQKEWVQALQEHL